MNVEITNSELLQSQTTTENQNTNNQKSNTQLVERERVENTGFEIIGNEENGYFIALGTYRLTQAQSKKECLRMIKTKDYELLLGLIGACIEANKIQTEQDKKQAEFETNNHPKKYSQEKERLKTEEDYKD